MAGQNSQMPLHSSNAIVVRNETGSTITARSIVKLSSGDTNPASGGAPYVLITAPSGSNSSEPHAATHELDIPNNSTGVAYMLNRPAWVRYNGTIPFPGENWGAVSGSFDIESSGSGLYVLEEKTVNLETFALVISLGGGGTPGGFILFQPFEVCDGIGFTCDCVLARVEIASCGLGLNKDDEINVWDPTGSWLQLPPDILYASYFYAQKMNFQPEDGDTGCSYIVTGAPCVEPNFPN